MIVDLITGVLGFAFRGSFSIAFICFIAGPVVKLNKDVTFPVSPAAFLLPVIAFFAMNKPRYAPRRV
jgi:hypothetical protein